ncbi:MAG: hypothetical protein ABFD94_18240, partial [Armatimonadia bacterium]
MSPYMQAVVNSQLTAAQREADIAATTRAGAATRAGAFGGSRQAIMEAEAQRALAGQKADIQAAGLQKAFADAQAQFNTEAALREQSRQFGTSAALQGAGQATGAAQALGALGQTQFGQQMDITQGLGYAGALRQAQEQAGLDVAYQDFLAAQKYPYEQLSWLQGITAGAPHSTTQTSSTRTTGVTTPGAQSTTSTAVQTPSYQKPDMASQAAGAGLAAYSAYQMGERGGGAAEGGVVGYAEGGITELMSDQQLRARQQNPNVPTIAKLAAEMQMQENAKLRQAQMAQPAPMRPTVAEEAAAGLAALPVRDDLVETAAEGGILGYADGGELEYVPFYEQALRQGAEKGSIYSEAFGLPPEERERRAAERAPRNIVLPEGTDSQTAELVRLQNPNDSVSVAGEGSIWGAIKRGLSYSSDVEAQRLRQMPNESPAEAARLARAGLPALAAAPAAPAVSPARPTPKVAPAAGRAPTARVAPAPAVTPAPAGLAATPEAAAAQPAAAPASQDPLAQMMAENRKEQQALRAQAQANQKAYNDAMAADLARETAEFEARTKDQDKPFEEKRSRLQQREAELDKQRKEARTFALLRAGLAMMSGESPYALVNIGKGLSVGAEGYAADMAKIDKSREALREQLDNVTELQTQMRAASGDKLASLRKEHRRAMRDGQLAAAKLVTDAGLEDAR